MKPVAPTCVSSKNEPGQAHWTMTNGSSCGGALEEMRMPVRSWSRRTREWSAPSSGGPRVTTTS
jgi:hypothetical protein